jgi:hypothetical protein
MPWGSGGGWGPKKKASGGGQGQQSQQGGQQPEGGAQGGGSTNPGGFYEEDMFGNATWHSYGGEDLHGDAAKKKIDGQPDGGRDGITGESPHYWG